MPPNNGRIFYYRPYNKPRGYKMCDSILKAVAFLTMLAIKYWWLMGIIAGTFVGGFFYNLSDLFEGIR